MIGRPDRGMCRPAASKGNVTMPIRPEARWHYPIDWPQISQRVRFKITGPHGAGRCWKCGRPHGREVKILADGRWFDSDQGTWRDDNGQPAPWPDIVEACRIRHSRIVLATCHLDHDPQNNKLKNLRAWCQRCHLNHDRAQHRLQYRITIMLRRALGDLFLGPYRRW
ncbi:MAG: hypothetical protein P4M00_04685 [Azospirillaceae bacterium]|nr:hypothetical protein [Azospirillaceae bacterium]